MSASEEDGLAEALQDETDRRGLTQEAAAELIGTTQQTFGKWLRGVTLPSDAVLPIVADFLGMTTDEARALRGSPRQRQSARDRLTLARRVEALEDEVTALTGLVHRLRAQVESRRR